MNLAELGTYTGKHSWAMRKGDIYRRDVGTGAR